MVDTTLVGLIDFALAHRVRGASMGDMGTWAPSLTRQEFAEECDINTMCVVWFDW